MIHPEIKVNDANDIGFSQLVDMLNKDLNERYQSEQKKYDAHNIIQNPECVVLAYQDKQAIGCAALKVVGETTAELKRMYVMPAYRNKGVAGAILRALEAQAIARGLDRIILETGKGQPEAIGLYRAKGYVVIDNYGPYIHMPESLCFEKIVSK